MNEDPELSFESTKPRVLVADDHPDARMWLHAILSPFAAVDEAADGVELLWKLSGDTRYAGIIVDDCMPILLGHQAVGIVRACGYSTPVLIVSGTPQDRLDRTVGRFERIRFLKKPLEKLGVQGWCKDVIRDSNLPAASAV